MGRMPDGMVNSRKENKIMLEKVKEIVAESLNVEESTLSETTSFKEDLGADSLDLFEMVMAFEEAFEVEIPSEDLEQITTVGDVVKYIESHKQKYRTSRKRSISVPFRQPIRENR